MTETPALELVTARKGVKNLPVEFPPILTPWGRGPLGEIDVY